MERAGILLLVLIALAVAGAPAHAAQTADLQAVAESRGQVVAYWTAERMRDAQPVAPATGDGKAPKAAYPFTRYEPTTYNPAHGKVFFTAGGANYVCSGTALASANESVVWTAGHCVNEGPGAYSRTGCSCRPTGTARRRTAPGRRARC